MALTRRNGARFQASIWPGFVDAMTALLLVLMFVLTIFMVVQFVLRETISGQATELDELSLQLSDLADALGLERQRSAQLTAEVGRLSASLTTAQEEGQAQAALIAQLTADLAAGEEARAALSERIVGFEAQVATLLSERDAARESLEGAEADIAALTLSLDEQRRRAEETLTLLAAAEAAQAELDEKLAAAILARDAAAQETEAVRAELGAQAEDLRAALAAELAARLAAEAREGEAMTEAEQRAALLAAANARLSEEEAASAESQRRLTLLNEQVAALRSQLAALQGVLDEARERDAEAQVQIQALGSQLNTALAQVASEQRRRAELEEAERKRLEAEAAALRSEAAELERYRSDFFGRLRDILAGREGVRVVGDRFVFSSEVLFQPGSATLAPEGREQIASVAALLTQVASEIPPGVDWILRVDGHTDNVPLGGGGRFADNWELSQGRALSVVRFMTEELGFPPERLAATGFGEYRPVAEGDTEEARAQNRRIELKLTER